MPGTWDKDKVGFVFGYDSSKYLVEEADSLPESAWKELDRESRKSKTQPRARPEDVRDRIVKEREYLKISLEEEHFIEIRYKPRACRQEYRMVILRKRLIHERGQYVLP
jgi:hypothetical protein